MKKCILLFLIILSIFIVTSCKKDRDKEQEEKDLSFVKFEEHFDDIKYNIMGTFSGTSGIFVEFSPLYQDIKRYFRFSEDYIGELTGKSKILYKKDTYYSIPKNRNSITRYAIERPYPYDYNDIKNTYLIDNKKILIEIVEKRNDRYYGYRLFVAYISGNGTYDNLDLVESIRFKYDDAFTNLSDEDFELLVTRLKSRIAFKEREINFYNYYDLKVNGKVDKLSDSLFYYYLKALEIEVPYPEIVIINDKNGFSCELVNDIDYEEFISKRKTTTHYINYLYSYAKYYNIAYVIDYDLIVPDFTNYLIIPNNILPYLEQIKILKAYEKRYWNDVELKEGRINTFNTLGITGVYYEAFPKLLINDDKCYVTLSNISKLIDEFEIITPNKTYSNHDFELYYEEYDSKTNEYVTKMNIDTMHYLSSIIYYDKINNEAYNLKDAYELNIITEEDIDIIIDKLLNYVY